MVAILNSVPMVYCGRYAIDAVVLPKCLRLNLEMLNSVVNLDLGFECAIYYWRNDGIYGMESMRFEQHLVELVGFDFD